MKKLLLLSLLLIITLSATSFKTADLKRYFDADRCVFVIERPYDKPREIKLCGKVRVVENFPDIKVRIVNANQDLTVNATTLIPSQCGDWQFVDRGEDFTIAFVDSFPDFTIRFDD